MKKDDAMDSLSRAGQMINEVNTNVWVTALNPTHYGWGKSVASVLAIPVLSAASVGQLVSEAVVRQLPSDVFDRLTNFGQTTKDEDAK